MAKTNLPNTSSRVVGGNTVMYASSLQISNATKKTPIAWLQSVSDTAPTPITQAVPVQPLGQKHPSEIVTANAVGPGTLVLTLVEKWNQTAWNDLIQALVPGAAHAKDILDVYSEQSGWGNISFTKIIRTPNGTPV